MGFARIFVGYSVRVLEEIMRHGIKNSLLGLRVFGLSLLFVSATAAVPSGMAQSVQVQARDSDKVMFNPTSFKYHIPSCSAARRCTHCIEITRKEAREKGGVPCKLCGAGE